MYHIDSVATTICKLMGAQIPKEASADPIHSVLEAAKLILSNQFVEKTFIYLPDAIGMNLYKDYKDDFKTVINLAPLKIKMNSVLPSVTPVCFASMFSGAKPNVHGIKNREKPVLKCDTVFDALARDGKKIAIIAMKNSSMDLIFRNRKIDYFTEIYDPEVRKRVLEILATQDYDFIVAYQKDYDAVMQKTTPRSSEAIFALKRILIGFNTLSSVFINRYKDKNRLIGFFPDHGAHLNVITGKGVHGTDNPDDIEVLHFWGFYKRSN